MTGDEERMAMLAGRPLDALDDDERELVVSWAELLKDPELWVEPPSELEDLVVTRCRRSAGAQRPLVAQQPLERFVGAPAAGRSGRGRRDRGCRPVRVPQR